jgi:multidrug efflux pump subunit AcrA (membrane-fusion protein)
VKNYLARVKIHNVPPNLRPGMSAEVEIHTAHHPESIVIPNTAVAVEGGRKFCYVQVAAGLERRPVEVEGATRDFVRVLSGLDEGEVVVADSNLVSDGMVIPEPIAGRTVAPDRSGRATVGGEDPGDEALLAMRPARPE